MVGQDEFAVLVVGLGDRGQELLHIDNRDLIGAAARDQREPAVGADRDIRRIGEVVVRCVKQNLINMPTWPQDAQPIGDCPTLRETRAGHQVLCAHENE